MDIIHQNIFYNYCYHTKTLSIGRIFISLIILVDLMFRFQNIEAHYTQEGVLPAFIIKTYYPFYQYYFSIHNFYDTIIGQSILFGLHFILAFFLLIGYKTTLFTVLNFIFLISLHHRNPLILQGGDDLLRITLFYMIFLPWGKNFSIDNIIYSKNQSQNSDDLGFSWIYVVFLINIAFIYLFSALLKNEEEWRVGGEAIYYALSLDTLRTGIGNLIYPHFHLLKIFTYIIYYGFEIFLPVVLIFSPSVKIRNTMAIGIILLHLFIVSALKVGLFPYVGISTAIMLLIPSEKIEMNIIKYRKLNFIGSIFIFILILRYNLATLNTEFFSITLWEDRLLNSIGLAQRWNMFSPGVKRYDGWLVLRGIQENNTEWDLTHNDSKIHYERTNKNMNFLNGDRWRKFIENYEQVKYNFVKPYFCYYLLNQWNKNHPEHKIESLNIMYIKKTILPNYQYTTALENLCICNPKMDKMYK